MPSYKRVRLVIQNKTGYVHIPKSWLDYLKLEGRLKPKIEKGKEVYYLNMIIDKDITIQAPSGSDISITQ